MLGELLLRHLNELRLRKVHCDLELIASNQTSVFVHKIVMTALNKTHFQQALRTAGCSRPLSPCISKMYFSTLSGDELRLLVEFLYGAVINKQSKYDILKLTLYKLNMMYLLDEAGEFTLENDYIVETKVDTASDNLSFENNPKSAFERNDSLTNLPHEREMVPSDRCTLNHDNGTFEMNYDYSDTNHTDIKQETCALDNSGNNCNKTETNNQMPIEHQALQNENMGLVHGNSIDSVQIKQELETVSNSSIDSLVTVNNCRHEEGREGQELENGHRLLRENIGNEVNLSIPIKQEPGVSDIDSRGTITSGEVNNLCQNTPLENECEILGRNNEKTFTMNTFQTKQQPEIDSSVSNSDQNCNGSSTERVVANQAVNETISDDFQENDAIIKEIVRDIKAETNVWNVSENYSEVSRNNETLRNVIGNIEHEHETQYSEMSSFNENDIPYRYVWTEDNEMQKMSNVKLDVVSHTSVSVGSKPNSNTSPSKKLRSLLPKPYVYVLKPAVQSAIKKNYSDLSSSETSVISKNTPSSSSLSLFSNSVLSLTNSCIQTSAPSTLMTTALKQLALISTQCHTTLSFEQNPLLWKNTSSKLSSEKTSIQNVSVQNVSKQPAVLTNTVNTLPIIPFTREAMVSVLNSTILPSKQITIHDGSTVVNHVGMSCKSLGSSVSSSAPVSMTSASCNTKQSCGLLPSINSSKTKEGDLNWIVPRPSEITVSKQNYETSQPAGVLKLSDTTSVPKVQIQIPRSTLIENNPSEDMIVKQVENKTIANVDIAKRKPLFKKCGSVKTLLKENQTEILDKVVEKELKQPNMPLFEKDDGTEISGLQEADVLVESVTAFHQISNVPEIKTEDENNSVNSEMTVATEITNDNKEHDVCDFEKSVPQGKSIDSLAIKVNSDSFDKRRNRDSIENKTNEDDMNAAVNFSETQSEIIENNDSLSSTLNDSDTPIKSSSKMCIIPTVEILKLTPDDIKAVKRKSMPSQKPTKTKQVKNQTAPPIVPKVIIKKAIDNTVEIGNIESVQHKSCLISSVKILQAPSRISEGQKTKICSDDEVNKEIQNNEMIKVQNLNGGSQDKNVESIGTEMSRSEITLENKGRSEMRPCAVFVEQVEPVNVQHKYSFEIEKLNECKNVESISTKMSRSEIALENKRRRLEGRPCAVFVKEVEPVNVHHKYSFEIEKQNELTDNSGTDSSDEIVEICIESKKKQCFAEVGLSITNANVQKQVSKNSSEDTKDGNLNNNKKIISFENKVSDIEKCNEDVSETEFRSSQNTSHIILPIEVATLNTETELNESTDRTGMFKDKIEKGIEHGPNTADENDESSYDCMSKSPINESIPKITLNNSPDLKSEKFEAVKTKFHSNTEPNDLVDCDVNVSKANNSLYKKPYVCKNLIFTSSPSKNAGSMASSPHNVKLKTTSSQNVVEVATSFQNVVRTTTASQSALTVTNLVEMALSSENEVRMTTATHNVLSSDNEVRMTTATHNVLSSENEVRMTTATQNVLSTENEVRVTTATQKVLSSENEERMTTATQNVSRMTGPSHDHLGINTYSQNVSMISPARKVSTMTTLSQNAIGIVTSSQNVETMATYSQNVSKMSTPSQNAVTITTASQSESRMTASSENPVRMTTASKNVEEMTTPSQNAIISTTVPQNVSHNTVEMTTSSQNVYIISPAQNTNTASWTLPAVRMTTPIHNKFKMTTSNTSSRNILPKIGVTMLRYPLTLQVGPSNKLSLCPIDEPKVTTTYITLNKSLNNTLENVSDTKIENGTGGKRKRHKSVPEISFEKVKKRTRSGSQDLLKEKRQVGLNKESKRKKTNASTGQSVSKKRKMYKKSIKNVQFDENDGNMEKEKSDECVKQRYGLTDSDIEADVPLAKLKEKLIAERESFVENSTITDQSINKEKGDEDTFQSKSIIYSYVYDNSETNTELEESGLWKSEENLEIFLTPKTVNNDQDCTRNREAKLESSLKSDDKKIENTKGISEEGREICEEGREICNSFTVAIDKKSDLNTEDIEGNVFESRLDDKLLCSSKSEGNLENNEVKLGNNDRDVTKCTPVVTGENGCHEGFEKSSVILDNCLADLSDSQETKTNDGVAPYRMESVKVIDLTRYENEMKVVSYGIPGVIQESSSKRSLSGSNPEICKALNSPTIKSNLRKQINKVKQRKKKEKKDFSEKKDNLQKKLAIEKEKRAEMRLQNRRKRSLNIKKLASNQSAVTKEIEMCLIENTETKSNETHDNGYCDQSTIETSIPISVSLPGLILPKLSRLILPKLSISPKVLTISPKTILPKPNMLPSTTHMIPSQCVTGDSSNAVSTRHVTDTESVMFSNSSSPNSIFASPLMSSTIDPSFNCTPASVDLLHSNEQSQILVKAKPATAVSSKTIKGLSTSTSVMLSDAKTVVLKSVFPAGKFPSLPMSPLGCRKIKRKSSAATSVSSPVLVHVSSSSSKVSPGESTSPFLSALLASPPTPCTTPTVLIFKSPQEKTEKKY